MNQIITIHTRFQQRRGTAARWAAVNPILQEGEIGLELDTRRIKFGDGVTAWNDLEYSTQELFPASATQLGGIIAADKGKNYTVEVQIDPKTHRLYIPAYPTMPELAAVATSGDYNDLDNTPAPYELPAATETVIGGVAAAQITTGYTVEVKKDPASHKLYVPAASGGGSVEDDGKLPGLVIRVIYKQQDKSTHFTNETGGLLNADIYFRPMCSTEYFNRIMPKLFIGLARCTSRHRQKRDKIPNRSIMGTQWHFVGAPSINNTLAERYPRISTFTNPTFNEAPRWTDDDVVTVPVADLISKYSGEWIRFPHDLETIVRRFIYIYQVRDTITPHQYLILPIHTMQRTTLVNRGYIKISGQRNRTVLSKARTKPSEFYASVNLGFCFAKYIEHPPNLRHYIFGPIAQKRAMAVSAKAENTICYFLKDMDKKARIL